MPVKRAPLSEEPISGAGVVEHYDKYARVYMMPEYKYFVRKILHKGIRGGKVLDLGTGSGRLAVELAKARGCNFKIVGLDISESMLNRARKNAHEARVEDKVEFVLASGEEIPFHDKSFDLVISYASLHHWFNPVKVFKEIQRVASENSLIIIRDNKRVYGNIPGGIAVWSISRFMSKGYRDLWPKAILASYTVPEVKAILKEAGLKDYKVHSDFVYLDLCIEARNLG
jgi:ubiquinone/menaquinone biosynthesis C-methylase UbiE